MVSSGWIGPVDRYFGKFRRNKQFWILADPTLLFLGSHKSCYNWMLRYVQITCQSMTNRRVDESLMIYFDSTQKQ